MPQPDFIMVGAQKAATTATCSILARHPGLFIPPEKELYFFSSRYNRGWAWYLRYFSNARPGQLVGESTPEYTEGRRSRLVAERMAEHLPEARLIYLVRHPIERLVSGYYQFLDSGRPLGPFADALRRFPDIVEASLYWERLNDFRRFYPDERIHIAFFEDFRADPTAVIEGMLRFLGVEPRVPPTEGMARNSRAEREMDRWPFVRRIRKLPGFERARDLVPRGVVGRLKRLYREPIRFTAEFDDRLREEVLGRVRPDAAELLRHAGRDPGFWDLDAAATGPAAGSPGPSAPVAATP